MTMDNAATNASISITAANADQSVEQILQGPVRALVGVTDAAAAALGVLGIRTVFDLATARVFRSAAEITSLLPGAPIPAGLLDEETRDEPDPGSLPIVAINGLGEPTAAALERETGAAVIDDLARWPPFVAAQYLADLRDVSSVPADPEIPDELVPKLNEYATERSTYSVFTIDRSDASGADLEGPVVIAALVKDPPVEQVRTGAVLRYEQTWTPVALTLGNLLHSLALAPGESTRVAVVDWTRRQGVSTTESLSQLDSLVNTLDQQRTVGEITRALAREAQQGFSRTTANSTVSNSAYTAFGIQNPGEAIAAAGAGAIAGATGVGAAGAIAGAAIGVFGFGASAVPGALIGGAAGAIVGGGAGAALGFMGAAQFGAELNSTTTTDVDVVTAATSTGTRDLATEMLQNVSSRTHQHSSNARSRRASIVQEIDQSENETVSTRVVTNYNHMHALTVQYFEVVQLYAVRNRLIGSEPCLYVPFAPIRWTPELVARFRQQIIANALTADAVYSLISTAGTVALNSPTFGSVDPARLGSASAIERLEDARTVLDDVVSTNPDNGWRLPESGQIEFVYGTPESQGGPRSPGGFNAGDFRSRFIIHHRSGQVSERSPGGFDDDPVALATVDRITMRLTPRPGRTVELEQALEEEVDWGLSLIIGVDDGFGERATLSVPIHMHLTAGMIVGTDRIDVPCVVADKALSMSRLIEHLDENTEHYTRAVLRSRGSGLVRGLLAKHSWNGELLGNIVDPEPIGLHGSSLVFSLHGGAENDEERKDVIGRREAVASRRLVSEELVPVATGGVFAEAVQGRANSAERLDLTRFWDWQDSPIPILPPEIAPVVLGSRATPADVRPGVFDPSPLALQSGAELPEPAGTGAALSAIQAEFFRDMSGLAEAAQLAQSSVQAAAASAEAAGGQVSESLRSGIDATTGVIEKVAEITGEFGNLLAEAGFSALASAGGAAGATGAAGAGSSISRSASPRSAASAGSAARPASSTLGQRNASIGGALLNEARRSGSGGAATPGPATGGVGSSAPATTGTPAAAGTAAVGATFDPAIPSSGPSSLEEDIIRGIGGIPAAGQAAAAVGGSSTVEQPAGGVPTLEDLLPAIDAAATSDRTFFAALRASLDAEATRQTTGDDSGDLLRQAVTRLAPAWRSRVERGIADANNGDLTALAALEELIAASQSIPDLGDLNLFEIIDRVDYRVEIRQLAHPDEVEGGETVTVSGVLVEVLPGGAERPLAGNPISMTGAPTEQNIVSATTGPDGSFALSLTHGVPDPDFDGIARFEGEFDLRLSVSATSPHSVLFVASETVIVPGAIDVRVAFANFDDNNDDAMAGSVVLAPAGRLVRMAFRVFKAGQPLVGVRLTDAAVSLNGAGTVTTTPSQIDAEGLTFVEYVNDAGDTGTAFLALTVNHEQSQGTGRADLQLSN